MTATIRQPDIDPRTCIFTDWCNGSCDYNEVIPERACFSQQEQFASPEFYETVGVELYGYLTPGDDSPVVVCLSVGDENYDMASTSIPPAQARELGNVLVGFRESDHPYRDAVLWHETHHSGHDAYIELRQPRYRRNHTEDSLMVEVFIREGELYPSCSTQLTLADARRLGQSLIKAADQAVKSNREFGLVEA